MAVAERMNDGTAPHPRRRMSDLFENPAFLSALTGVALQIGDSSDAVRDLQTTLKRHGFTVTVSGTYDADTAVAVAAIQREMKRPANGVYDDFIATTLERADSTPGGLEATAVASAAGPTNVVPLFPTDPVPVGEEGAGTTALAPTPSPQAREPQTPPRLIQVPAEGADAEPVWKKPAFWLLAGGAMLILTRMWRTDQRANLTESEDGDESGVGALESAEEFFRERKPRRRRKPRAKKPAEPRKRRARAAREEEEEEEDADAGQPVGDPPADPSPVKDPAPAPDDALAGGEPAPKRRRRKKKDEGGKAAA